MQVGRRVADRQSVPLEQSGHGRDAVEVLEQERGGSGTAEHDRRLEAPQFVGVDGAVPPLRQAHRQPPARDGTFDQAGDVGTNLLRGARGQTLAFDDRVRQRVERSQRRTQRSRCAASGRKVGRVDAIPGKEVHDDDTRVAQAGLAEQLGSAEGEETSHTRGERAQRAHLRGELGGGRRVGRHPHDHTAPVVEVGDRCVVAAGRSLGESADSDDADPRESRRDRRG